MFPKKLSFFPFRLRKIYGCPRRIVRHETWRTAGASTGLNIYEFSVSVVANCIILYFTPLNTFERLIRIKLNYLFVFYQASFNDELAKFIFYYGIQFSQLELCLRLLLVVLGWFETIEPILRLVAVE